MFEENDKWYRIAKRIHKICCIALCVLAGVGFITCVFIGISYGGATTGLFVLIGFGAAFVLMLLAGLIHVFGNLSFSKHYDIKVIRDRLCEVKNSQFYTATKTVVTESGERVVVKKEVNNEEALKLKALLDAGIITEAEYNAQING